MRYPAIAESIISMKNVDQNMRRRILDDPDYWDYSVDRNNTSKMREIVTQIGWPTISKVGSEASSSAWLLVQHADKDIDFQKHCLALMNLAPKGDIDPGDIAYLEDRVQVNCHQPQTYGTQFEEIDGRQVVREIYIPEDVDLRRQQMGLGTLEEGIKEMQEKYHAKQ